MSSLHEKEKQKRNRNLPHRNRQHVLRPVFQPKSSNISQRIDSSVTQAPKSVSKPIPPPKAKPFRFFDLPGEIRNRVYDLVIPETRVVVSGSYPQKELQQLKQLEPLKKHKTSRYRLLGKFSGTRTQASLLFTCHRMNQEVVKYVYSRTTFCFDRFFVLRKFLNTAPKAGCASIQSLEIIHVGYSEPVLMADRAWKLRHDAKWTACLQQIKRQTALRRLVLDITFFDWPIQLDLSEEWAQPLLELAGDGLDRVDLKLEQDRFPLVRIASVAAELERRMMTAEGRKKKRQDQKRKEAEEKMRLEASKRKAKKVLNISLPNGVQSSASSSKVVKSKGLEQYAIAEPPVGYC